MFGLSTSQLTLFFQRILLVRGPWGFFYPANPQDSPGKICAECCPPWKSWSVPEFWWWLAEVTESNERWGTSLALSCSLTGSLGRVGSEPQATAPTALPPCSATLLTLLDSGTLKISLPGTRSPLLWEEPTTTSSPCSGRSLSTPRYCEEL